jgi:hypothetical protein
MFKSNLNILSKSTALLIMFMCSAGLASELSDKSDAPRKEITPEQYLAQILRLQIVPEGKDIDRQILYDKQKNPNGHFIEEKEFYNIATDILGAAILGPSYTNEQRIKIIEHARGQGFDLAKVTGLNPGAQDAVSLVTSDEDDKLFSPSSSPTCAAFFSTYLERFDDASSVNNGPNTNGFELIKALANGSSFSKLRCNNKTADDLIAEIKKAATDELAHITNELNACVEIKECEELEEEKQDILEEIKKDNQFFGELKDNDTSFFEKPATLPQAPRATQAARTNAQIIPLSGVDVVFTNGAANCASNDVINNLGTEIDRFNRLRQTGLKSDPYLAINSDKNCEVVYQFHPAQAHINEQTRVNNERAILNVMTTGRSSR